VCRNRRCATEGMSRSEGNVLDLNGRSEDPATENAAGTNIEGVLFHRGTNGRTDGQTGGVSEAELMFD